jgi:hypothetical protein
VLRRRARTPSAAIPFAPLKYLLTEVGTEPEWIWERLVAPGSLTLLAGQPKVGKSTLLYGLLGAMSDGAPFLDRPTRQASALILSEEPREAIHAKVARFGGQHHGVARADLRAFTWPEQIAQATEYALAHGAALVVVDTLAELAGLRGEDENDAGAILGALDPLKAAAEQGLAVLIVHHQRKSGGRYGAGVRGSGALVAAVDVSAELNRGNKSTSRTLTYLSRFDDETHLALNLTPGGYVAVRSREDEDFACVLAIIDRAGAASTPELKDALSENITPSTIERRLQKMHSAALIDLVRGTGTKNDPHVWSRPL